MTQPKKSTIKPKDKQLNKTMKDFGWDAQTAQLSAEEQRRIAAIFPD